MIVPFSVNDFIDRADAVYGERTGIVDEPDQPAAPLTDLTYARVAELARAQYRRRTLPEQTAVEEAETTVRGHRDAVVRAKTSVSDLGREVAKLEQEVTQVRTREDRDRGLMDSGSVSAKQMTDLSHELDTLARRRGVLEDEQLEVMERLDAAETDLAHEQSQLETAETSLADAVERQQLGGLAVAEGDRPGLVQQDDVNGVGRL